MAYIVLVQHERKVCYIIDTLKVRYQHMTDRISKWSSMLDTDDNQMWMITLTYKPGVEWDAGDIRKFMNTLRYSRIKIQSYAWVAEMQRRGAVHYHVMVQVPKGVFVPHVDDMGWWDRGMSRTEKARTVWYLVTYVGKEYQKDFENMPCGCRAFAVWIKDRDKNLALRFSNLPYTDKNIIMRMGWERWKNLRDELGEITPSGWRFWHLCNRRSEAIEQGQGWQEMGYEWQGKGYYDCF